VLYCGDGDVNLCGEECDPPVDFDSFVPMCCGDGSCCSLEDIEADTCTPDCKNADGTSAACIIPAGTCVPGCRESRQTCTPPSCPSSNPGCGDGCFDTGEECDDGNTSDGDGCSGSCAREYCGDGVTNNNCEECDLGSECTGGTNAGADCSDDPSICDGSCQVKSDDSCTSSCLTITCGDCRTDPPKEECDDGTPADNDGCDSSCQIEYCGDGTIQDGLGEQCDDKGVCFDGTTCKTQVPDVCPEVPYVCSPGGGTCSSDADCGTGICTLYQTACAPQACDGCNNCQIEICGNGIVECDEECDDGDTVIFDGCYSDCTWEFCGDGRTDTDGPDNKPGKADYDDDGNGVIDDFSEQFFPGTDDEQCDDGFGNNDIVFGACRTDCRYFYCGDGVVDSGEECDVPTCPDGSLCTSHTDCGNEWCRARNGQGRCSALCTFEGCSDGKVQLQYGEECDDGGTESGDGCSATCQWEEDFPSCGNGVLDPDGGDGQPGIARFDDNRNGTVDDPGERGFPGSDDEECDFSTPDGGVCPNGTTCNAEAGESCDLGECDPVERICSNGNGFVCVSDADCKKQRCIDTCTPYCKKRVFRCGDGYRDLDEQCDDGNRRNGDGCSFYCTVEYMDLCGNGIVDESYGEECDQGHPFHTVECTPYCRLAQGAPICGDGRRDTGGRRRGDVLGALLTFSQGYRLDWRIPSDQALWPTGTYGWYVTPRVFPEHQKEESAFPLGRDPELDTGQEKLVDQNACDRCGDGLLDTDGPDNIRGTEDDEACDSGRKSKGLYPAQRANFRGWGRMLWAASHARFGNPFFWNRYYNLFPFGFYDFYTLTYSWFPWNWDYFSYLSYVNGYGSLYGYYAESVFGVGRSSFFLGAPYVQEPCFRCELQRCGNNRIDPGETCDDGKPYGAQDGDGCSSQCFQEDGFNFNDPVVCGDDIISAGEQCDDGGLCVNANGDPIGAIYCRKGEEKQFCRGGRCEPISRNGCSSTCQILPLGECGNGLLEPYEECDDGKQCDDGAQCTPDEGCEDGSTCMAHSLDGCTVNCFLEPPRCGNGITEPRVGEQCDPPGNGCSTTCHLINRALCSNGIRDPGEQCDAGENNSDEAPNACREGCVLPFCGDGVTDRGEECDGEDGCSFCVWNLCGNGFVDAGEQCDPPGNGCSDWCIREGVCGNAELDSSEDCDDGNVFSDDGCSARCTFEYCGDGVLQPGLGEECDVADRNANKKDACRLTCQLPFCGDDIVDSLEACDPGKHCAHDPSLSCKDDWQCPLGPCDQNKEICIGDPSRQCKDDWDCLGSCIVQDVSQEDGTVCLADCSQRFECGDGIVQYPEECDFRSPEADEGGCQEDCTLAFPMDCGNGRIEPPEQCDDGNRADHDGCTEFCRLETMECDDTECAIGFTFICEGDGAFCQQESAEEDCTFGPCVLKPECATACVFGDCGNGSVDPGEQCDNGRHCSHDPLIRCANHADCRAGGCQGANPSAGIPGACDEDVLRACMTDADCQSLCVPMSNDGCSSSCQAEEDVLWTNASLRLCTDDVGTAQVFTWKQTLLNPNRNPFIERPSLYDPADWSYWGWGWSDQWWEVGNASWKTDSPSCALETFPNSLGNLLRSIVRCFESATNADTIPDRVPFMPFQPTGILSYAACQEPRAQLVSAVEMPALPVFDIPPYRPSELVRELEKYICGRSGFPRRNFLFLCEASSLAPAPRSIFDSSLISLQKHRDARMHELMLAHALDVGYRASESMLSSYLRQAFSTLASSLQVSLRLFSELERINFADQVCPLDGDTSFCTPSTP